MIIITILTTNIGSITSAMYVYMYGCHLCQCSPYLFIIITWYFDNSYLCTCMNVFDLKQERKNDVQK